jgi:hypothetical protein
MHPNFTIWKRNPDSLRLCFFAPLRLCVKMAANCGDFVAEISTIFIESAISMDPIEKADEGVYYVADAEARPVTTPVESIDAKAQRSKGARIQLNNLDAFALKCVAGQVAAR